MPLFSVIIPTYNRADLLRETLDSVLAQSFKDYEIIVVDDGSTDATEAVVQSYGGRIHFLRQQNRGPGAARNLGLRHATGTYVAFLDSDDLWFPWTLETYRQLIAKTGEPAFIAGKPRLFTDAAELNTVKPEPPLNYLAFQDYFQSGDEWRWWGVSSFVVRRAELEQAGGFTNEWINGEDADLAMRLGEAQGFVQILAPATFAYRRHPTNATKNMGKTLAGAQWLVQAERCNRYGGGPLRAGERWRIITRHIRPAMLGCLQSGLLDEAWRLYGNTFWWHLKLGRWKFLLGFPVKWALARLAESRSVSQPAVAAEPK